MKSVLSKIGSGAFIFLILFIGLKGCFVTVYCQDELLVFQDLSETGELNTVYVAPSNYLIFKKQYDEQYEYGVFKVRATNATHYFGPIYSTGQSILGLRIYSGANKVWKAEMELVDKQGNLNESTFEDFGEKFSQLIIFRDSSVELGNFEYQQLDPTSEDVDFANSVVNKLRNN